MNPCVCKQPSLRGAWGVAGRDHGRSLQQMGERVRVSIPQ